MTYNIPSSAADSMHDLCALYKKQEKQASDLIQQKIMFQRTEWLLTAPTNADSQEILCELGVDEPFSGDGQVRLSEVLFDVPNTVGIEDFHTTVFNSVWWHRLSVHYEVLQLECMYSGSGFSDEFYKQWIVLSSTDVLTPDFIESKSEVFGDDAWESAVSLLVPCLAETVQRVAAVESELAATWNTLVYEN